MPVDLSSVPDEMKDRGQKETGRRFLQISRSERTCEDGSTQRRGKEELERLRVEVEDVARTLFLLLAMIF